MNADEAVALSLLPDIPRYMLIDRLRADDPELCERARSLLSQAREARKDAAAAGIDALAWSDTRFPAPLLPLSDCPPAIWYRGTLTCFDAPAVAIVGSRAATAVALEIAGRLAADLAARGVTVVSGLARGVDSAAHRGALQSGRTVAVLGSGVDWIYPREHRGLADQIARTGAILSEHPPGTAPLPFHFPLRNRLISGLSRAVVVVEASEQSGSLITAACALQQGRDVMAVPGNALSGRNRGGHALIRDGAKIVECADDILAELGLDRGGPPVASGSVSAERAVVSADPVLRGMDVGQPYDLDALASATGLDVPRLLPRLVELELDGRVRRVEGGCFMRPA
jgi:DNA processing protein